MDLLASKSPSDGPPSAQADVAELQQWAESQDSTRDAFDRMAGPEMRVEALAIDALEQRVAALSMLLHYLAATHHCVQVPFPTVG